MVALAKPQYDEMVLWQDETLSELEMPAILPRVQYGDIWRLGEHRLLCGDSTSAQDVARLFDGEQFSLCFTSPPYSDQRTYTLGSFDWNKMMCGAFDQMIANGTPGCHILVNLGLSHKNRQVDMYWLNWLMHCAQVEWPMFGWYVWDKLGGMPGDQGGRLAPTHEFVFHFNRQNNTANKWVPTQGRIGCRGFRQKDGSIKGPTSPEKRGQEHKIPDSVIRISSEKLRGIHDAHPAVFPVGLPEFIYRTWSQPGGIVYEPFSGSGTSIIAAERLKRRCYAIDIEPTYCDLAITRWERATGKQAVKVEVRHDL